MLRSRRNSTRKFPDPRLEALFIEPRGPLRAQGHRDASLGVYRRTSADAGHIDCTPAPSSPHIQRTLWPSTHDPPRSGSLAPPPPRGIHLTRGPTNKACALGGEDCLRPFVVGLILSECLVPFCDWGHINPTQLLRVRSALPPRPLAFRSPLLYVDLLSAQRPLVLAGTAQSPRLAL